ncbi:MAG: PQQ-binding-like beta-propeller repeat protein [Rubripirellula sp.]
MPSDGIGGLMVTPSGAVVVSGRSVSDAHDLFSAFSFESGKQLWEYQYKAVASLDYGNSPRATPVYSEGVLVTLGASGVVTGLDATSGVPLWTLELSREFRVPVPTWGFSGSPLVIEGQVLLQVADAPALISIDLFSGKLNWKVSGDPAAYASLMPVVNETHVVGVSENGYFLRRVSDGRLVWSAEPNQEGDFGVATPVMVPGGVVFTSENNGVQLFGREKEDLSQASLDFNESLLPDSHTPVAVGNQLLVADHGLHSLRLQDGLREAWVIAEEYIHSYASIIASSNRALVTTEDGRWLLASTVSNEKGKILDHQPLSSKRTRVLAHPAVHEDCIFVRVANQIRCYRLPR